MCIASLLHYYDVFYFTTCMPWRPRTKRGMLATMNLMFGPLGFVTPVIVEAKLIYRSLCQKDLDWDEPLPQVDVIRWEKWILIY